MPSCLARSLVRLADPVAVGRGGPHPHDMQAREATAYSTHDDGDGGDGDDDAWNEMSDLLRPISVICSPNERTNER